MGVVSYAISRDTPEVNRRFAEWTCCPVPILSDVDGEAARAYGVIDEMRPLPARMTFFIDAKGRIARVDRDVSPTSHGQDIVQHARALGLAPIALRMSRLSRKIRGISRRTAAQPAAQV